MKNKKTTLLEIRNIQVWCEVIVFFKALGFKSDGKIALRGEECKDLIEYEIGEELRSLAELQQEVINKHTQSVLSQREEESETPLDEQEAEQINNLINADPDIKEIGDSLSELWNREVEMDFEAIKITPPDNCAEKFGDKPMQREAYGFNYVIDPYQVLIEMVKKGHIIQE